MKTIDVKRLTVTAKLPTRGTPFAAGLDLYADEDCTILQGNRKLVSTGIAVQFDAGHYLRIAPRSGLAVKSGIDVLAGVVDSDYRGEVRVALINLSSDAYVVHKGDRIAQAIVYEIDLPEVVEVAELTETVRGEGGYGSTGR